MKRILQALRWIDDALVSKTIEPGESMARDIGEMTLLYLLTSISIAMVL